MKRGVFCFIMFFFSLDYLPKRKASGDITVNLQQIIRSYVMRCAFWYYLYNLKSVKNTKNNTPPWVFFTFFKLYKWYHQIARNASHMVHQLESSLSWSESSQIQTGMDNFSFGELWLIHSERIISEKAKINWMTLILFIWYLILR